MNNEQLFRQALQRQNERAMGMRMPDDMEQRVMKHIGAQEQTTKHNALLVVLRLVTSTAAAVLIGFFLYVYAPTEKKNNDYSYNTTNWTGGNTLRNVYISSLQSKQKSISYIQLKQKLYEKN